MCGWYSFTCVDNCHDDSIATLSWVSRKISTFIVTFVSPKALRVTVDSFETLGFQFVRRVLSRTSGANCCGCDLSAKIWRLATRQVQDPIVKCVCQKAVVDKTSVHKCESIAMNPYGKSGACEEKLVFGQTYRRERVVH